jgi:hypothetical protein
VSAGQRVEHETELIEVRYPWCGDPQQKRRGSGVGVTCDDFGPRYAADGEILAENSGTTTAAG